MQKNNNKIANFTPSTNALPCTALVVACTSLLLLLCVAVLHISQKALKKGVRSLAFARKLLQEGATNPITGLH